MAKRNIVLHELMVFSTWLLAVKYSKYYKNIIAYTYKDSELFWHPRCEALSPSS